MTPIRETIARAICFERADCDIWHDIPERSRRAYRDEADAVLRALDEAGCVVAPREPTEAMIDAGGRTSDFPSVFMGGPSQHGLRLAARVYRAMISASVVE